MQVFSSQAAKKRRRHRSDSADFTRLPSTDRTDDVELNVESSKASPQHDGTRLGTGSTPTDSLPVAAYSTEIVQCVLKDPENKVLLVQAETGSGKSTLIPSFFLNSNFRMVVTQPRRVAAITLAHRVASQQKVSIGQQVGYRVRFDDRTNPATTRLIYATDGMLLREALADPLLHSYSIIFLDEAHERSLQTDILMGVVQRARLQRAKSSKVLHVVIMSATLHTETFVTFFGRDATRVIEIPGRQFPVDILYTEQPQEDLASAALSTIVQIHKYDPPASGDKSRSNGTLKKELKGDILVFLPGQEEIEDLAVMLKQYLSTIDASPSEKEEASLWTGDRVEVIQNRQALSSSNVIAGVLVCVLYAALPPEAQLQAFAPRPPGCARKVILATNIAETSVTLPDVKYVVDTGKVKTRQASSATGMERLAVEDVSHAQAAQRAGRAGRVQPGICFRLCTEHLYDSFLPVSKPEILRVNLAHVVLQLKGMGVKDPTSFEFVTPPEKGALIRATQVLFALSAVDDNMDLTECGKQLAKLPLDPMFGSLLLQSAKYRCTKEMLIAVSVLSCDSNLLVRPSSNQTSKASDAHRRFLSHEGDLPTGLTVYQAWQREAVFLPPASSRKAQKRHRKRMEQLSKKGGSSMQPFLSHTDWCRENYISGRALSRAWEIRAQLERLCRQETVLGLDVESSCLQDWERFYKCVAAGLFLHAASRVKSAVVEQARGRYQTKVGNIPVAIHPTSAMFNRNPAPKCVVYTELVTTKKNYIRGVTQIREEWLQEVAPKFFS